MALFSKLFAKITGSELSVADWDELRKSLIEADLGTAMSDELIEVAKTGVHWRLLKGTEVYWRLLKESEVNWRLLKVTEVYWRLLKGTEVYWRLLTGTEVYWRLPKGTGVYGR